MLMQMHDLLDSGVLLEMAYTQKKAERVSLLQNSYRCANLTEPEGQVGLR